MKELRLNPNGTVIREINPEDLVLRFAQRLEFGAETMRVANDAVRIVQRMNRDWMTPGRRPAGIVAAALIIAARMNDFRRTAREVVYVAKVNEMTILKRLEEFKVLESSGLTIDEFRAIDLEQSADPPSFYRKKEEKKKRGRKRKHVEFDDDGDELGTSPTPSREASGAPSAGTNDEPSAPANKKKARRGSRRGDVDDSPSISRAGSAAPSTSGNDQLTIHVTTEQAKRDRQRMPPPPVPIDPSLLGGTDAALGQATIGASSTTDEIDEGANDTQASRSGSSQPREPAESSDQTNKPSVRSKRGHTPKPTDLESPAEDAAVTAALTDPFTLDPEALQSALDITDLSEAGDAGTPLHTQRKSPPPASHLREIPTSIIIGEDEFDDDPEVRNCLLGDEEVSIKTRIWTAINADWIRQQAAKKMKHEIAVANGTFKPRKTRQRKRQRMGDLRQYASEMGEGWEERLENGEGLADSAAEAVSIMMKKRAYSNKINYEALKDVYTPSSSASRRTSIGGAGSPGSGVEPSAVAQALKSAGIEEQATSGRADEEGELQQAGAAKEVVEVGSSEEESEDDDEEDYDRGMGDDDPDDPYDAGGGMSD